MVWPINEKGSLRARPSYAAKLRQVNALLAKLTLNPSPNRLAISTRSAHIPRIEMPRECPPALRSERARSSLLFKKGRFDQVCKKGFMRSARDFVRKAS